LLNFYWGIKSVQTKEYTLENGLRVVVQPDKRAPVVVAQIWYKVGSADEPVGMTGISHALEHMMFKGTPTLPLDGYSECISKNGGQNNAFTTDDYTAYYAELDASKLDLIFELEADRMVNLSLNAEDFAQERKVIMEERRMRTDDNPPHLTFEHYRATANKAGPYHHPVIGWMKDIEHLSIEQLRAWYETWYRPNNAIIVVVGDVEPDVVFKRAHYYFGQIPNTGREVSKLKLYNEHTPGPKYVTVKAPAKLPYLIMGFDVPTSSTGLPWEPYALALVSGVLDGGESTRFAKNLIRGKNLAASASTHYEPFKRYTTQFDITGIPREGVSVATLKTALWDEINALKKDKLSEQELNKIKTQFIADELFQKDSMSEQAINIGEYEAIGLSWRETEQFIDNIKKITADNLQQVAQKYFTEDRLTVAVLEPQPIL
jgi:zinc protease